MKSFDDVFEMVQDYCMKKIERGELTQVAYNLWINCLKPVDLDENVAHFSVSSEFQANIIKNNYTKIVKEALREVLGFEVEMEISVLDAETDDDEDEDDPGKKKPELERLFSSAEYSYTFDTFIVGRSNEFAYAACTAVAKDPGSAYNPLFIHGPSGLGKTHLVTAISNEIKRLVPETNIVYVTGEAFTNELIDAIKNKKDTGPFHQKYRGADVLIIDDVQFIAGKESTQEEFFHTFNELHKEGKQIVLTSDRPPKDIKTLEDRIRNRFEWGLIADISTPDFETRVAIIMRKAELLNLTLTDEISEEIANKLKRDIRQLEGCVKKLKAGQHLMGTPPTMAQAQNAIREIISEEQLPPITIERIISEVAGVYGVTAEDIYSKKRSAQISIARKVGAYVIKEVMDMSFQSIGMELGARDHSTIMYYYEDIGKLIEKDQHTREMIEDIIKNIKTV